MNSSDSEENTRLQGLHRELVEGHLRLMYLSHMYVGKVLENHGLQHIHQGILEIVGGKAPYLRKELPLSVSDIARTLGLTPATNTALIDKLEQMELLERTPDPHDRRVTRVRLIPKGEALLQDLHEDWMRHAHQLFSGIPEGDLKVVQQVMETLEGWYGKHMKEQM